MYLIGGTRTSASQNACVTPAVAEGCTRRLSASCSGSGLVRYQCPISVLQRAGLISGGTSSTEPAASTPSTTSAGATGVSAGGGKSASGSVEEAVSTGVQKGVQEGISSAGGEEESWWSQYWGWVVAGVALASVLGVGGYMLWQYVEEDTESFRLKVGPTGTLPLPATLRQQVGQ